MTQRVNTFLKTRTVWQLLLLLGAICALVMVLLVFLEPGNVLHLRPAQAFNAWFYGWIFWFGISLGSMGIVMMHHLVGGKWGYPIRRFAEHAGFCVPAMAILFIPILLGVTYLYPWAHPDQVAHDAVLRHKAAYLNWPFWSIRAIVILLVFSTVTWVLRSRSLLSDRDRPEARLKFLSTFSAPGQVIYFAFMSLAAVDWIMSREPHWYSTVFGFIVIISQALSAMCVLILLVALYRNHESVKQVAGPNALNDLASLLLMFVVLWAYLSFAQLLVTWLGNNQTEITWYVRRTKGGWWWVGAALMLFHFLIPFILLLMRPMKRKMGRLAAVAGLVLVMRAFDVLYWLMPGDINSPFATFGYAVYGEALNVLGLVAVGAFWLAALFWLLKDGPLVAVHEAAEFTHVHQHDLGQRTI
jgi:hypothetical protein